MTIALTGPQIATQIIEDWIDRYVNHKTEAYNLFQAMVLVAKAHSCCGDDDLEDAMWSAYDALYCTSDDTDLVWAARQVYRNYVAGI